MLKSFKVAEVTLVVAEDASAQMDPMKLMDLMGGSASTFGKFYRYSGSLTTPGCYESVTWTVFEDVLPVSASQVSTCFSA